MGIGTLNERGIHQQLKEWFRQPGDRTEVRLDGFIIDLVHQDRLFEIQSGNFGQIRRKIQRLVDSHEVQLIHPIVWRRTLVTLASDQVPDAALPLPPELVVSRRRSPKHGSYLDVAKNLVYITNLLPNQRFSVRLVLVEDEELRCADGKGSWRRRGVSIVGRRLVQVVEQRVFRNSQDWRALVPFNDGEAFSTAELATALKTRQDNARRLVYVLKKIALAADAGRRGRTPLYTTVPETLVDR